MNLKRDTIQNFMDVLKILPSFNFRSLSTWLLLIQYILILDAVLLKSVKILEKFQ